MLSEVVDAFGGSELSGVVAQNSRPPARHIPIEHAARVGKLRDVAGTRKYSRAYSAQPPRATRRRRTTQQDQCSRQRIIGHPYRIEDEEFSAPHLTMRERPSTDVLICSTEYGRVTADLFC
jgi:hypothetical protein